jgi:hypothetical protein
MKRKPITKEEYEKAKKEVEGFTFPDDLDLIHPPQPTKEEEIVTTPAEDKAEAKQAKAEAKAEAKQAAAEAASVFGPIGGAEKSDSVVELGVPPSPSGAVFFSRSIDTMSSFCFFDSEPHSSLGISARRGLLGTIL